MRILIAPDAFKGSLTSCEAAAAMAAGIRSVLPGAEIITMPLADGGEGTLDVVQSQCGGEIRNDILYFHDHGVACGLIESARLIGLTLPNMQADVFGCGSSKLGLAVLAALDTGVQDIRVALGGTGIVDGGLGLFIALGCRVLNHASESVSPDLNGMMQAKRIDASAMDQRLQRAHLTILCDVKNPLCGIQGAVYGYGAQKGIPASKLTEVETAMRFWGALCEQTFGVSAIHAMGSGAAGGLGFALNILGGKIVSGAEYVMNVCGFEPVVKTVDWVVTGEGKSDVQTLNGKLPIMVSDKARQYGVNTALISGSVEPAQNMEIAFDVIHCVCPAGDSVHQSMADAGPLLKQAAARWSGSFA